MSIISKINFKNEEYDILSSSLATCESASDSNVKEVILNNFVLIENIQIKVKFTYGNTSEEPFLNVNSTGAYPIVSNATSLSPTWEDEEIVEFVFHEEKWIILKLVDKDLSIYATSEELESVIDKVNSQIENLTISQEQVIGLPEALEKKLESIPLATSEEIGGVKIGYEDTETTIGVELNESGQAYITLPSALKEYKAGEGLSLSEDNVFSISNISTEMLEDKSITSEKIESVNVSLLVQEEDDKLTLECGDSIE